ncbi:MAG: twin-arginine translocation signal domain-containing protein [Vicinamibacterales bacterium]
MAILTVSRKDHRHQNKMKTRRDFLKASSVAALGLGFLPLAAWVQGAAIEPAPRPDTIADGSIGELERLIPRLMQESNVPGAAIALVRNGQLRWRRGFGVKDTPRSFAHERVSGLAVPGRSPADLFQSGGEVSLFG